MCLDRAGWGKRGESSVYWGGYWSGWVRVDIIGSFFGWGWEWWGYWDGQSGILR